MGEMTDLERVAAAMSQALDAAESLWCALGNLRNTGLWRELSEGFRVDGDDLRCASRAAVALEDALPFADNAANVLGDLVDLLRQREGE